MPEEYPLDGSWEHALADADMARAALERAFEDYLAKHLAVAGVTTMEQLPKEVMLMAMIAWSEVFTRLSRDFKALMTRRTRDGLQDEPVGARDWFGRVEELAALYRLGEMPPR